MVFEADRCGQRYAPATEAQDEEEEDEEERYENDAAGRANERSIVTGQGVVGPGKHNGRSGRSRRGSCSGSASSEESQTAVAASASCCTGNTTTTASERERLASSRDNDCPLPTLSLIHSSSGRRRWLTCPATRQAPETDAVAEQIMKQHRLQVRRDKENGPSTGTIVGADKLALSKRLNVEPLMHRQHCTTATKTTALARLLCTRSRRLVSSTVLLIAPSSSAPGARREPSSESSAGTAAAETTTFAKSHDSGQNRERRHAHTKADRRDAERKYRVLAAPVATSARFVACADERRRSFRCLNATYVLRTGATLIALMLMLSLIVANDDANTSGKTPRTMYGVLAAAAEPYGNDDDYDDEPESSGAAAAPLATFASGSDVNNSDDDEDDDDDDEPVAAAPSNDYPDESYADDSAEEEPNGGSQQDESVIHAQLARPQPVDRLAEPAERHLVRRRREIDPTQRIVLLSGALNRIQRGKQQDDEIGPVDDGDEDAWVHDGVDDIHIDAETKRAAQELANDDDPLRQTAIDAEYDPNGGSASENQASQDQSATPRRVVTITEVMPVLDDKGRSGPRLPVGDDDSYDESADEEREEQSDSRLVPASHMTLEQVQRLLEQARRVRPLVAGEAD